MKDDMSRDKTLTEGEQASENGPGIAPENVRSALEALLFVSDEPVSSATLADILGIAPTEADTALAELSCDLREQERGIQLREVAGGWRLYSHPAYHELIEKYILSWDTHKLSQAALEALAVIAYRQPITRGGVNAVRGVNSEGVISSLTEKGLIRPLGREKGPGGAILYGTTRAFLEKFGLKSLKDLPPLEDFAPDEETSRLIRERLSAGSISGVAVDEGDLDDLEDAPYGDEADGVTSSDGDGDAVEEAGEAPDDGSAFA
jgi:segregation and condensation protein B